MRTPSPDHRRVRRAVEEAKAARPAPLRSARNRIPVLLWRSIVSPLLVLLDSTPGTEAPKSTISFGR
jgi:hypothetical protein